MQEETVTVEDGDETPKKALSLRERIISSSDIPEEMVEVAEWGVALLVRGMTGKQRTKFLESAYEGDTVNFSRIYPDLLIHCCVDPTTGNPVFEQTDRDLINEKSAAATERIAKVAMKLSGIGPEAEKNKKEALKSD